MLYCLPPRCSTCCTRRSYAACSLYIIPCTLIRLLAIWRGICPLQFSSNTHSLFLMTFSLPIWLITFVCENTRSLRNCHSPWRLTRCHGRRRARSLRLKPRNQPIIERCKSRNKPDDTNKKEDVDQRSKKCSHV